MEKLQTSLETSSLSMECTCFHLLLLLYLVTLVTSYSIRSDFVQQGGKPVCCYVIWLFLLKTKQKKPGLAKFSSKWTWRPQQSFPMMHGHWQFLSEYHRINLVSKIIVQNHPPIESYSFLPHQVSKLFCKVYQ